MVNAGKCNFNIDPKKNPFGGHLCFDSISQRFQKCIFYKNFTYIIMFY